MNDDPRLDPLEEEALRRVRVSLMRAVRSAQPAQRGHRHRTVGLVLAVAVALGIGATVVTIAASDPSTQVDIVGGDPSVPTSTHHPGTSIPATSTSTTALPPPEAMPVDAVAVTTDGRLVVVDVATGAEQRELARLGDPTLTHQGEGPPPNAITNVTVDRGGGVVYYESCCEPASGSVFSVPLAGGEPARRYDAGWPAVSADGRYVAALGGTSYVMLFDTQEGTMRWAIDAAGVLSGVALSADGSMLAIERSARNDDDDFTSSIVVLPTDALLAGATEPELQAAFVEGTTLHDPEGIGYMHPAFRRDGNLVVAQQCCYGPNPPNEGARAARVLDPRSGEVVGSFSYPAPVADQEYDVSGTWLLVTLADGRLVWFGAGGTGELPAGYLAADW